MSTTEPIYTKIEQGTDAIRRHAEAIRQLLEEDEPEEEVIDF